MGGPAEDAGPITTRVECGDYFDMRDQALLAHATQVDPDGSWFQVPREMQQRIWPTEDFEAGACRYVPVEPRRGRPVRRASPTRPPVTRSPRVATSTIAYDGRKETTRVNGAPSSMVSPGLWGFLAFFLLAIALYLLMRNMNARMRRMSYRSEELRARGAGRGGRAQGPQGRRRAHRSGGGDLRGG